MTTQTRREFIKTFGAALAAALSAGLLPGCTPTVTCYAVGPVTPGPSASPTPHPAWMELRQAWLDVARSKTLAEVREYRAIHSDTLGALVIAGALDAKVAAEMQRAFVEATNYYNGTGAMLPTCYTATAPPRPTEIGCYVPPTPTSCYTSPEFGRLQWALSQQIRVLAEMDDKSKLDPATLTRAQTALEQDIAVFTLIAACEGLPPGEHLATEDRLVSQFQAAALEAPPEALEAARILVVLLVRGEAP
jgi:hypothetical protein